MTPNGTNFKVHQKHFNEFSQSGKRLFPINSHNLFGIKVEEHLQTESFRLKFNRKDNPSRRL